MKKSRALLLLSACLLGSAGYAVVQPNAAAYLPDVFKSLSNLKLPETTVQRVAASDSDTAAAAQAVPAWAAEATMNPDYVADATANDDKGDSQEGAEAVDAVADIPAWALEATMNPDYVKDDTAAAGEGEAAKPAEEVTVGSETAWVPGVTQYYGVSDSTDTPAWAAEAAMNPDYAAASPAAEPSSASETAAAEPVHGVTQYYGTSESTGTPAWAAEAVMNPDYETAAAAAPEAAAAEQPAAAAEPVPGVTQYYGTSESTGTPAWAAEAAMNPDYSTATAAVESAPAPVAPQISEAKIEACRDALNAEVKAGKLYFATESWGIEEGNYRTLDKVAKVAKDCGDGLTIEVGGHTDNTGKPESNKTLSQLRADAVSKYLARAGVDATRLTAVGYGQDHPTGDNKTVNGRRENRRIEFQVNAK